MIMNNKLPVRTKMGAGFADMGGNVFFAVINFWLMYYFTDMVGLSAVSAGLAIMIGKCWDALTDLSMGYISDHTKSRWGRRKIFMVVGLIPLFITVIALFTKINIPSSMFLLIYYTTIYCLVNTFYTVIFIPYYSLLSELTDDYHDKTSLQSFRMLFALVGSIIGSVLAQPIVNIFPDKKIGFTVMAVIFAIVITLAVLVTVLLVKEPKHRTVENKANFANFFKSYDSAFKNTPFVLVIISMILCFIALVITQATIPYFFKYYLNLEKLTSIGILVFALSCIFTIPVVLALSKHFGKKKTWIGGLIIASIGGAMFYITAPLGLPLVLTSMAVMGAGGCSTFVLVMSLISDCADLDCLNTGERKDGLFMGIMTFSQKVGMALGAAIVGWILGYFGYVADTAQRPAVLNGMRVLVGIIPGLLSLLALIVFSFFPISEKKHDEIIQQIKMKEKGGITQ